MKSKTSPSLAPLLALLTILAAILLALPVEYDQPAGESPLSSAASIKPLTDEQLRSARTCDIDGLLESRYPPATSIDDLPSAYDPQTDCDWAVLTAAYIERLDEYEEPPEAAKQVFARTYELNPAFALHSRTLFAFIDSIPLNEPLPITQQTITTIDIAYTYAGMGASVNYLVTITDANTNPHVSGDVTRGASDFFGDSDEGETYTVSTTLDSEIAQALGPTMRDFIPIDSQFSMSVCYDNYPDWNVAITFEDGSVIEMVTNDSNFFYAGGPWQTTIDGQSYVQFSPTFLLALIDLAEALELPFGETMAMSCFSRPNLLNVAFPDR